jgi:hypothetical protein
MFIFIGCCHEIKIHQTFMSANVSIPEYALEFANLVVFWNLILFYCFVSDRNR